MDGLCGSLLCLCGPAPSRLRKPPHSTCNESRTKQGTFYPGDKGGTGSSSYGSRDSPGLWKSDFQPSRRRHYCQCRGRALAAASQAAAPSPSYSYSAPAVDDSLEASLLKQGIITRAEYERIKGRKGGNLQAAPAAAPAPAEAPAQLVASLQTLEKTIANCTVRAPISGVISQVYIGDTHLAMAGKPALVIRQDSPVTASVQIPAKLDNVMDKAKDDKTLTVTMSDGSEVWYGELKKQPNENGDKFTTYKVQVDNPDDEITIGNEYSIRIESGQNVSCYMIPKSAIIGDSTVAVVNDDNLVDMKSVSIASDTGGYVLVMDGLAEGDRVITDPLKSLDMGMQVDVK